MDTLILSCGTGGGHDAAAKAIMEEFIAKGHNAVMLNPYTLQSDELARKINAAYNEAAQKAPRFFGVVYKAGQIYRKFPFRSPVYFANAGMVSVMQNYLESNNFDIVIMTHLFPAEIITNMKNRNIPIPKTMFIATDYTCIPFTEETKCDAYVIPSDALMDEFHGRGIPKEKLYPLGIPVQKKFSEPEARDEVRKRLGLDTQKRYVLVTGGSMGGGEIEKTIEQLLLDLKAVPDTEAVIICGSNRDLYDKLKQKADPNARVIGYTDDMAGYMKACDLFVTKPGGLSSTEAAVSGIPILHTGAIPGCETCNAGYFNQRGMSYSHNFEEDNFRSALEFALDNSARAEMLDNQRRRVISNSAERICSLAETLIIPDRI